MVSIAAASLIGAIISGVVAAGSAVANTISQAKTNEANANAVRETNEANLQSVRETNTMNEQLTREQWARDDSQLQRARKDAEKAGFSPLAALSSNLTNSNAATMQAPQISAPQISAPQFDSSGITDAINSGTNNFINAKVSDSQIDYINSQKTAQDLENNITQSSLKSRINQNIMQTIKLAKELQSMDLNNEEKAMILKSNGADNDTIKAIIGHDVNTHKSTDLEQQFKTAQKNLTMAQTTTEGYKQSLNKAQELLATAQRMTNESESEFWYGKLTDGAWDITYPRDIKEDGSIEYGTLGAQGHNRKELLELYNQKLNQFKTKIDKVQMDDEKKMKIWQNVNQSVNAVSSFFMPIKM